MKQSPKRLSWLVLALLLVLALAACERPAPREEVPVDDTTLPQPTVVIPTTAPTTDQGYPAPADETPTDGGVTTPVETPATGAEEPATGAEQPTTPEEPATADPTAVPTPGDSQPETPVTNAQGEQIHIVQLGENLFRIGLRYGIAYEELGAYNGIPAPYTIYPGQEIRIPPQQ
ncbi:MAG: LysM peptidoglycan-binding domain-containing protein, partial [Anaerolineales bacterium]|nr:LysM peptidoglycan-binding domain-containing protein [Anaerolineales bacterium]